MSKLQDGYYWMILENEKPEIVQVLDNEMYRCGSDVVAFDEDGEWNEYGEPLKIVSMRGPIKYE